MDPIHILNTYGSHLLSGLVITIQLAGTCAIIALLLSPGLALLRLNGPAILRLPILLFVSFMRGTPLLAQLFLVYFGSGQFRGFLQDWGLWSFFRDPYFCAVFTFTMNTIAYQIEIMRGGLKGVPQREIEASKAIGMNRLNIYRRVIFPHAYRIAWPALGNDMIMLIKASALASIVTILDLMGETRRVFADTFDLSVYLWAAIAYLLITGIFVFLWRQIELVLSPHIQASH